jgi:hypothetical protein
MNQTGRIVHETGDQRESLQIEDEPKRAPGGEATRWKPGQSGNPSGRPKKLHITDAIRAELEREGPDGIPNDEAIARVLVELARTGNMEAIREIADRTEGKARQRIESGSEGGAGIPVSLVIDL